MSKSPSPTDAEREIAQLKIRIERLEGMVSQLKAEQIRPGMLFPDRREFQSLELRLVRLETKLSDGASG